MVENDWEKPPSELRYFIATSGRQPVEVLWPELGPALDRVAPLGDGKTTRAPSITSEPVSRELSKIDPTVEAAFRRNTNDCIADARKIAKTTIEQINGNPVLKKAIANAASATHIPKENLVALTWFESGGGKQLKNTESGASGPFQLLDPFYYTSIVKYGRRDKATIGRYALEAAKAFERAAPFIEFGPQGEIIFHNDEYAKATKSKNTIREDLKKYQDDPFVQAYFVGAHARENNSFSLSEQRLVHNYGVTGARAILAAKGNDPIASVLSPKKMEQNRIPDTISVEAFRDALVRPFTAVAEAMHAEISSTFASVTPHAAPTDRREPRLAKGRHTLNTAELKKPATSGSGKKQEAAAHQKNAPRHPKMPG